MTSVCKFYIRGNCRFGNRCWYSHDLRSILYDSLKNPAQGLIYDTTDSEDSVSDLANNSSTSACSWGSMRSRRRDPIQEKKPNNSNEKISMWTLTNNETGEKHNGNQDTILLETVKQLNESEKRLRNKTDGVNFYQSAIESDLQCDICYELFIKPTVLNCSHTFCHECIESWTRIDNHCPTCRICIESKAQCLIMDSFLDKIAECLPEDVKTRRKSIQVERLNNSRGVESAISDYDGAELNITREESFHSLAEWNIGLEESFHSLIDALADSSLERWD